MKANEEGWLESEEIVVLTTLILANDITVKRKNARASVLNSVEWY